MDYLEILKGLSKCTAVSGHEEDGARYIKSLFEKYSDEVYVDRFYNVSAVLRGIGKGRHSIMVTAHYDEIGMIVKDIDKNGFLRVTNMGGIDSKVLLAQEVIVHGRSSVKGVIGAKPPHLLKAEEIKKAPKIEELYIDTGMDLESVKKYINIGDVVTFDTNLLELKNGIFSSKTQDNRCGVAVLLGAMEELSKMIYEADVYFVATSQEETGATGALIAAYNTRPDIAIVVDACHGDMVSCSKEDTYQLGKGPAIGVGPVLHKRFTKKLFDIGTEENIPVQIDVEPDDTGTEACVIQVSRHGVPSMLISVPVRYMHTAVETVHIDDIKNSARLIASFIRKEELNKEVAMCR